MPKTDPVKKAVDFLFVMNAAITNIRLYPPTSAIIISSVERLYKVLNEALSSEERLEYAESEKSLLVQGSPLPEKEQKKPQVGNFLEIMLDLGIKSISITRGITRKEISAFLQILGKTPAEIQAAGGIAALVEKFSLRNIRIDEKIYVEVDSDHSIMSGMDLSDRTIARMLLGEEAASEEVMNQLREIAQSPEWLSTIFQTGVREVIGKTGRPAASDLSSAFAGMINALDGISDFDKQEISKYIISSMSGMEDDVLISVLTQNLDTVFGADFFNRFVKELDAEKFANLFERVKKMAGDAASANLDESQFKAINRIYDLLKDTEPGRRLLAQANPRQNENNKTVDTEKRLKRLKAALYDIARGDTDPLTDREIAAEIPGALNRLLRSHRDAAVNRLVEKLGDALLNEDPEIREAAAGILCRMDEMLEEEGDIDRRMALAEKLSDWIKYETSLSAVYKKVTGRLKELSRSMIKAGRGDETGNILEAYHLIASGNLKKDEAISALAVNMLQNLATEDIIDLLLKKGKPSGHHKGGDDIYTLVILGSTTVERLLDRLHDSHNMSERKRIIQAISRIGKPAIQPIIERLGQDGPWYYIRNLVLLLGRIGDESHVSALEPLLAHSSVRVQAEAIKSIRAIGDESVGRILVKHLKTIDDSLKAYAVSILGATKTIEAVPLLLEMLEDKTLMKKKAEREDVKEKICEALGRIGSPQALGGLEKIVRSRRLFGIGASSERVRQAAIKALANIKRKEV